MALTEEQRLKKKNMILQKASQMLARKEYVQIKMEDLALQLDMSKGALYRFFSSKEEIFLQLYVRELEKWLIEIEEIFLMGLGFPEKLNLLVERHCRRTLFLKLISMLNSVLEKKLDKYQTLEFKFLLLKMLGDLSQKLACHYPFLLEEMGPFLIHYNAHCIGLLQMSRKSRELNSIFANHPELSIFNPDLERELKKFVHYYFFGPERQLDFD